MFPFRILLSLYMTLIYPSLTYGILAWGNSSKILNNRILILQKRIIRIIHNVHFLSHTNSLFLNNNILKIDDLYNWHLGIFMFQLSQKTLPSPLISIFTRNSEVHSYPTRQSNQYHPPLLRTSIAQKTVVFTGPKYWNEIDQSLKLIPRLSPFKKRLKQIILESYSVLFPP